MSMQRQAGLGTNVQVVVSQSERDQHQTNAFQIQQTIVQCLIHMILIDVLWWRCGVREQEAVLLLFYAIPGFARKVEGCYFCAKAFGAVNHSISELTLGTRKLVRETSRVFFGDRVAVGNDRALIFHARFLSRMAFLMLLRANHTAFDRWKDFFRSEQTVDFSRGLSKSFFPGLRQQW